MALAVDPFLMVAAASFVVGFLLGRGTASGRSSQTDTLRFQRLQPLPEDLEARVRLLIDTGRKIEALKELRQATGLGLKEAKDVVDSMAAGRALPDIINGGSSAAGVVSNLETTNHADAMSKVKDLVRRGKTIEAIKLYREASGVGLKEAKDEIDRMARELG